MNITLEIRTVSKPVHALVKLLDEDGKTIEKAIEWKILSKTYKNEIYITENGEMEINTTEVKEK